MDKNNQINNLISSFVENVKEVVSVDSVIGEPIKTSEGVYLIPITKISVGFVAGGGEYGCDKKIINKTHCLPFAGGGGGGVTISPIGFIEVKEKTCKLIRLNEKSVYQNILDKIPGVLDGVSKIINKGDKCEK